MRALRGFVALAVVLSFACPSFAAEADRREDPRVYTNEDLEKYRSGPTVVSPGDSPEAQPRPGRGQVNAGTILRENEQTVVAVASLDVNGVVFSHGSGFFAGREGIVVTCLHVIKNAAEIRVKSGQKVWRVRGLLLEDRENDVALLKTEETDHPGAVLGNSESAASGEKVYAMGNPRGQGNVISEGTLLEQRESGSSRRAFEMTASLSEGMSGGPVFNGNGEVIGIASFVLREGSGSRQLQSLNFAVPVNIVKDALAGGRPVGLKDIRAEEPDKTAEYWSALGDRMRRSARYREAVEAYKKALEIDPDLPGALNALGTAYLDSRRYREAIDAYRQALKVEPDSAWIYSNLGLAYMESGMDREAIEVLTRAVRLMPELGAAHFNLGLTYRRLGMYREASEEYKNAVKANPGSAEAHFQLGLMYLNLNEPDSAEEEYRILKDIDPSLAERLSSRMRH